MFTARAKGKESRQARAFIAALILSAMLAPAALAQFAQPLMTETNPLPPPVGDGPTPAPVTPGDYGAPLPPPSGVADRSPGNPFPQGQGKSRTTIYVYRRTGGGVAGGGRGDRMVQTIRPDQLSEEDMKKIEGILGVNMLSGEESVDVTATDQQIEQIQDVIAKYPQYESVNGRKKINQDARQNMSQPWVSTRGKESLYEFQGPLPTVRTFCRYLVLLGVCSATIWMAIAATGVILGHRDGAGRVIGTAAGLMLLLCGYTIWKVVQMNTFNANSDTPALSQNRPNEAQTSDAYIQGSTVPPPPAGYRQDPERSGVPLVPLGGADAN